VFDLPFASTHAFYEIREGKNKCRTPYLNYSTVNSRNQKFGDYLL
jgi:hypothetical protein